MSAPNDFHSHGKRAHVPTQMLQPEHPVQDRPDHTSIPRESGLLKHNRGVQDSPHRTLVLSSDNMRQMDPSKDAAQPVSVPEVSLLSHEDLFPVSRPRPCTVRMHKRPGNRGSSGTSQGTTLATLLQLSCVGGSHRGLWPYDLQMSCRILVRLLLKKQYEKKK